MTDHGGDVPGSEQLTVAVAQATSVSGDIEENVRRSALLVERYAEVGLDLMVFPELSLIDYELTSLERPEVWVTDDDARLDPLRQRCRDNAVHAVVGAAVRSADGRAMLASLFVDSAGDVHVQPATRLRGDERRLFEPAEPGPLATIKGWRAAGAIGGDVADPDHARAAAAAGADLYLVSTWYDGPGHERMGIHLASRAMDYRMFALGANHARTPRRDSCGGSGIWAPDGSTSGRASFSVQVMVASIDRQPLIDLRVADQAAWGS